MSAQPAKQMSNLQQRVVSALILAAIVLSLTWFGGLPFRVLCAVIGAAMLYEWLTMSTPLTTSVVRRGAWIALGVTILALLFGLPAWIIFAVLGLGVLAVAVIANSSGSTQWAATGLAYAGLSAISMALLRGSDWAGFSAILFLFAVVWATDIAAYFVGRAVGGPKLAPAISPGKTQSGALGGAAFGVLAGVLMAWALGAGGLGWLALVALLLSVVSQAGDLYESWVKRRHGVKDSSQLIPGHGGVMDRADGLVAAALVLCIVGGLAGGFDTPASALFG